MLGDTTNGSATSLQSYTDALSEVSSTPGSDPGAPGVAVARPRAGERLQNYDSRLRDMAPTSTRGFAGEAREVTLLAQGIARLNGEITVATQSTGQPPNDLLDQRDRLIDELSTKVSVTTVAEGASTLNVFIGNGQPLVLGTTASEITTVPDPFDPERTAVRLADRRRARSTSRAASPAARSAGCSTGAARCSNPARNELGRISLAIANQVNAQHREGMDLTGALGGDFFNVGGVGVTDVTTNTGTAMLDARHAPISAAITGGRLRAARTPAAATRCVARTTARAVTFTGTGTRARSDPRRRSCPSWSGRGLRHRRPVHHSSDARCGRAASMSRSPIPRASRPPRRFAPPRRPATPAAARSARAKCSIATNAQLLTTANIVFTSADARTPSTAARADVHGGRQHRCQRLARADQRHARDRRHVHGAQQRRRHRRQPQRVRARRMRSARACSTAERSRSPTRSERLTADVGLQTRTAQVNRDAEAVGECRRPRRARRGVGRQSRRGSGQHAAFPAGLPGRRADHRDRRPDLFDSLLNAVRR